MTERLLHFARRPASGARPSPFSAGISGVPLFGRDQEMVYRQADAALYWVKRHGRGAVEVFEPERDQLPDNLVDVARNAVQEVIMGRLLSPVFQPIVDLRTGRVLGFEGLIRPDPTGPLPDTTQLFAAAAAAGRTVELDVACIEQVLVAARAIGPDRLLTLNLSPRTLEVRDFDAGWLLQGLYRNGISPGRVIVELTERDEIDDLARLRQTFRHLREYGLRLAADDVGAGNAGLRLLSQVQFDIVKLDLSLVQDGVRRMGARSVLQSLRDLALDQHAHVVAEGVETAAQLQVLRDLQIGAGQGYLLGRPEHLGGGHLRGRRPPRRRAPRGRGQPHPGCRDRPRCAGQRRIRASRTNGWGWLAPGSPGRWATTCAPSSCPALDWAASSDRRPAPPEPPRAAARRVAACYPIRKPVPLPSCSAPWRARHRATIGDDGPLRARAGAEGAQRRADLGHHAPGDDALGDEPLGLLRASAARCAGRRRRARRRCRS